MRGRLLGNSSPACMRKSDADARVYGSGFVECTFLAPVRVVFALMLGPSLSDRPNDQRGCKHVLPTKHEPTQDRITAKHRERQ